MNTLQKMALSRMLDLTGAGMDYASAEFQARGKFMLGSDDLKQIRIAYEAVRIGDLEARADRSMGLAFLMPQAE